jgi:hypothetical protein
LDVLILHQDKKTYEEMIGRGEEGRARKEMTTMPTATTTITFLSLATSLLLLFLLN